MELYIALPPLKPILRIFALSGKVQPLGQMLSVAGVVLFAGLLDEVSSSAIVPAEAKA